MIHYVTLGIATAIFFFAVIVLGAACAVLNQLWLQPAYKRPTNWDETIRDSGEDEDEDDTDYNAIPPTATGGVWNGD